MRDAKLTDGDGRPGRRWRGYARLAGLFLLVFILSRLEMERLGGILLRIDAAWLLAACLLNVPLFFAKALRWRGLLKIQKIEYSLKDSVLAYAGSSYLGFLTPGRLGDLVKVFHVRKDRSVPLSRGMPSAILDRLFDVYLLVLVGTTGLWKFGLLGKVSALAFLGPAMLAAAPLLLLSERISGRLLKITVRLAPVGRIREKLDSCREEFFVSAKELASRRLLFGGALTVAAYLVFFLQCWCLARGLGIARLDFVTVTFFMGMTNLVTMIPISVAGLGTRDATLIYLFSLLGLEKEAAVGFSLLLFFSFYVIGGLLGLACWLAKPVEVKT